MTTGCIGCGDTSWFQAWDKKEFQPQAVGTLKIIMTATVGRLIDLPRLSKKHVGLSAELCKELGIPYE